MSASTVTLGILVTAATGAAHGALQSLGQNMERLKARVDTATQAHGRLGEKIALAGRQGRPVQGLSDAYVKLGKTIEEASRQAERFAVTQEKIAGHKAAAGELWGRAVGVAGLGLAMAAPAKAAMDFESAFADVKKVVDGTDEELNSLSAAIMNMGRSLPLAHTEIAALAAAGGQLGVALKDLPAFVETTAKMAVAFDMGANEAGDAMAKVANVYKIPIAEIGRLGDAINQISNESPAKAGEIVRALSRVGGVASAFGLSAEQASALSGAFIAMGKPPEVAATAVNALLLKLQTADKQSPKFQAALASMGMSAGALKKAIGEDAQGALLGFLQVLSKLPKDERMGSLVDLFGLEYSDDIAALAGNMEVYVAQLDAASRSGGSMGKEFEARAATTANNMQLLKNTVSELAINIGSVLLPPLNSVLSSLRPVVEGLASWAKENPGLVSAIGKLAAALLVFKAGSLAVRAAFHLFSIGALGAVGRLQALRAAWLATSLAMQTKSLSPVLGPLLGGATPAADGLLGRLREIANSGAPMKALGWHLAQIGAQAKLAALSVGGALKGALLGAGQAVMWLGRAVLLNPVGLALTAAAMLVYKFWGPISGFFRGLWSGLKAGLAPIGAAFRAAFVPAMPALRPVGEWLSRVAGWLGALLRPIEDTGGAAEAFGVRVGQAIEGAVRLFLSLPGRLLALPGEMLRLGGEIVAGLINGIQQKLAAAGEAIKSVGASVRDTFKDMLGIRSPSRVFAEMGGEIVAGLINGIKQKLAAAGEAIKSVGASVRDTFKDMLGIRSPSRVFAEMGGNLSEGLALGMGARLAAVTKAAAGLATAASLSTGGAAFAATVPALPDAAQVIPDVSPGGIAKKGGAVSSGSGMVVHYAPVLNISAAGADAGAVRQEAEKALSMSLVEFEKMMRRYEADKQRRSVQ